MNNIIPLKIPTGWAMLYNSCFNDDEMIVVDGEIDNDLSFKEDILSISQVAYTNGGYKVLSNGYTLDLGWYPDADPSGNYKLVLLRESWDNQIINFESKNKLEVQSAINEILYLFSNISIEDEAKFTNEFNMG